MFSLSCAVPERIKATLRCRGVRLFMMKEKEDSALALVCAGGDALDVELLHDDEQDGDGDGHQHAACTEECKVVVDQRFLQHIVQADGHRPVGGKAGVQDHLGHHKVRPRHHEGADDGVHQNGSGHGQNHLEEYPGIRRSCGFQGATDKTATKKPSQNRLALPSLFLEGHASRLCNG